MRTRWVRSRPNAHRIVAAQAFAWTDEQDILQPTNNVCIARVLRRASVGFGLLLQWPRCGVSLVWAPARPATPVVSFVSHLLAVWLIFSGELSWWLSTVLGEKYARYWDRLKDRQTNRDCREKNSSIQAIRRRAEIWLFDLLSVSFMVLYVHRDHKVY